MNLIFLLGAEVDIQSAYTRHESFQAGRGLVFMRCLDAGLTLLRTQPHIGRPYAGPYRRLLVSRFPYGVSYEAQSERLVIAAVMDLRQSPKAIKRLLLGD